MSAHVIAVVNQKGGVGKSTTTVNLSMALSILNKKVLVIDTDGQCNTTDSYGIDNVDGIATLYDLLFEKRTEPEECIQKLANCHIIAGDTQLNRSEQLFPMDGNRFSLLKRKCEALREKYDYILIDTNPSLGSMMINVLSFADKVIIPIEPNRYALKGISDLTDTIESVKGMNPNIKIEGFLLTKYDGREQLSNQYREGLPETAKNMGTKMFNAVIRKCADLSKAQGESKTIFEYNAKSSGAEDYLELAKEIISKGE